MSFKNEKQFKERLKKRLTVTAHKHAKNAVQRSTMLVEAEVQKSIKNEGTGRVYSRKAQPPHTASSAGDPPATDQGDLGNNITINITSKPDGSVIGQVISASPYSKALEFGTTNMQARPFMQPALNKNKNKILNLFKKEGIIK